MQGLGFNVNIPQFLALQVLGKFKKELFYKGPFATCKLMDVEEPTLPGPDWVKIKTLACGFCGSDLNLILLKDSPTASPFTSFPCILGHEFCGAIIEKGEKVETPVETGDLVTVAPHLDCQTRGIHPPCQACIKGRLGSCENLALGRFSPGMFIGICKDLNGGFAPYVVAHQSQVFSLSGRKPWSDHWPLENTGQNSKNKETCYTGTLIEPLAVALQSVLDNFPNDQDRVLIIGGGVIGNLILRVIRGYGLNCDIAVLDPSPLAQEMAQKQGADQVLKGKKFFDQAAGLAHGRAYKPMLGQKILMGGFTRIFDTVGNGKTVNMALRAMAVEGVLSLVGIGHKICLDPTPIWLKLQTIKGVYSYGRTKVQDKHIYDLALDLVEQDKIKLFDLITHTFSLDQYQEMIEKNLHKAKYNAIKTIVHFDTPIRGNPRLT